MAWLQADPSGNYHVSFRFGGRKFKRSLRTKSGPHAEGRRLRLEENIRLVESGRLVIPAEADVPMFLLSDGKLDNKVVIAAPLTLSSLFESYLEVVSTGHLEETTIACQQIHRRSHMSSPFCRVGGAGREFSLTEVKLISECTAEKRVELVQYASELRKEVEKRFERFIDRVDQAISEFESQLDLSGYVGEDMNS